MTPSCVPLSLAGSHSFLPNAPPKSCDLGAVRADRVRTARFGPRSGAPYPGDGPALRCPGRASSRIGVLGQAARFGQAARISRSASGRPAVQHRRGRYKAHCDCHRGDGRGVLAQSGASKGRRRTPTMPGFSTSSTIALPPERLAPSSRTAPCRASRAERARSDAVGDRARLGCTRLPGGTLLNRAGRLLAVEPERRRAAVFESAGR